MIFLDESFRQNRRTNSSFGVLAGLSVAEDRYHQFQDDVYHIRLPYHGVVLKEEDELKGRELLGKATFKSREMKGYSYQWNLAEELIQYCARNHCKVFGVVCFRPQLQTFVCGDEYKLDMTFRGLFERIDRYMKHSFPGRHAKLIFDDRDPKTNNLNSRAITNFFTRHAIGIGYDGIFRTPLFAVSQGHNYGLQIADLITTIIALKFQGERRIQPLFNIVRHQMLDTREVGGINVSSLKILRNFHSAHKKEPGSREALAE